MQGNWSAGGGGSAGPAPGPEGEEAGSGSGFGSGYGGGSGVEWTEGGAMLSAIWETEGLQTVGIVVLVFASIKLLHILGLISFSEGKRRENEERGWQNVRRKETSKAAVISFCEIFSGFSAFDSNWSKNVSYMR